MVAHRFFEDLRIGEREVSDPCSVRPDEVLLFLDLIGDWTDHWRDIFAEAPGVDVEDSVPGLLLLGHQWGHGDIGAPLLGIVATYRVNDIRQHAPLRIGEPYRVESRVIGLEPVRVGFGNVLTERRIIRADGTPCLSMVEKARFRTREAWEAQRG